MCYSILCFPPPSPEKMNFTSFHMECFDYNWMCSLTVHECPPSIDTTSNCIACGIAKANATIQTPIMNLSARDNFDMVCCLKKHKRMKRKKIDEKHVAINLFMDGVLYWFIASIIRYRSICIFQSVCYFVFFFFFLLV